MKKILLIGNANCGKTTLFNTLTKSHRITGNRLGVTVDADSGIYKSKQTQCEIIDLPGVFSLSPYSEEEKVVSEYLKNEKYDGIICVADSLNPERSFKLLLSLSELRKPVTLAFNFCDLAEKKKIFIDAKKAENILGIKCVKISAAKGKGIDELMTAALSYPSVLKPPNLTPEKCVSEIFKSNGFENQANSLKADKILVGKKTAYIFLAIFAAVIFLLTFSGLTAKLSEILDTLITDIFCEKTRLFLNAKTNPIFSSLVCDGIIKGCGSVLGFLPQITVLTVLLAIFEDSGYLSRTAYILDSLFGKIGLQGKCFFCLMTGFGCSVPAVMSSRVLENRRDRLKTVLLIPFIPCSAKLPLFLMLSSLLFNSSPFFVPLLYVLGCATGIIIISLITKFEKKKNELFLLELPPYRMPSPKGIKYSVITRLKDFLTKAGTVLVMGNILIWFLTNFTTDFTFSPGAENCLLHIAGKAALPIFAPLGFDDWRQVVSMFSGVIARESIVSSLKILYNSNIMISAAFTKASALSFCVFSLLAPPCISAVTAMGRELKNAKILITDILLQTAVAYGVTFLIYNIGCVIFQ